MPNTKRVQETLYNFFREYAFSVEGISLDNGKRGALVTVLNTGEQFAGYSDGSFAIYKQGSFIISNINIALHIVCNNV